MRQAAGGGRSPKTRILILSDGIAGHDRSSLGIVAALAKHREVHVGVLPLEEKSGLSRRLKRGLASILPPLLAWRAFYRPAGRDIDWKDATVHRGVPAERFDLVVSTGPRTAAANIALARLLNAKNVYFGPPKWPGNGGFTLLLTPRRASEGARRAFALRPSELDLDQLRRPSPLVMNGTERRATLLIGGQSKHYRYGAADMELLADRMIAVSHAAPWLKWTVYDSRRTPNEAFESFVRRVSAAAVTVEIVRFSGAGLMSNASAYSSDLVLVTADSMSMIAESIAARRPTGVLFAGGYVAPRHDRIELDAILAARLAFRIGFSALTAEAVISASGKLDLPVSSQLQVLHDILAAHGI